MAKAFSIARALNRDHTKIVEGHLDADDWIGKTLIDPDTLEFNTGFVDKNGNEIFTGDILLGDFEMNGTVLVKFCDEHGAFELITAIRPTQKLMSTTTIKEHKYEEEKSNE